MKGTFYSVGVGPGDPEDMTLKAVRTLQRCPVVAAPRTRGQNSLALSIAQKAVDLSDKEILHLDFLMSRDERAVSARHDELAALVIAKLDAGSDVAMLSLGDASVFASCGYLQSRIRQAGFDAVTVAGLPSFCACAARLGISLTAARLPLRIIPGDYPGLERELAAEGSKVVMKQGKDGRRLRRALERLGLLHRAMAVENCGLPGEAVYTNIEEIGGGYFTTVVIPAQEGEQT